MKIWLNGKLVDRADAKVSVFDHGLLYGDGVFEGIRVYNGRIFQCKLHIDRLFESAKQVRLAIPYTKQELTDAIHETLAANKRKDAYIRLVATRGEGNLGLNPFKCTTPTIFIIAADIALYPKEMYDSGMAVIIAKTLRTSPSMLNPAIKSLNYLNNIMAKIEAIDAGTAEAIMLNGIRELAIMKMDILDGLKAIKICTAYKYKGKLFREFPYDLEVLKNAKPFYKEFRGWAKTANKPRNYRQLHSNAKVYLEWLQDTLKTKISIVSVGSSRDETIFNK